MSKYNDVKKILRWCNFHVGRDFYYHEVGVSPSALSSLCKSKFRGKIWIVKKGNAVTRDGNNGLAMYNVASWVDLDNAL